MSRHLLGYTHHQCYSMPWTAPPAHPVLACSLQHGAEMQLPTADLPPSTQTPVPAGNACFVSVAKQARQDEAGVPEVLEARCALRGIPLGQRQQHLRAASKVGCAVQQRGLRAGCC